MGDIAVLAQLLAQAVTSADAAVRQQSEEQLKAGEVNPQFCLLLLKLIETDAVEAFVRESGAIHFKNFVKFRWMPLEGEPNVVPDEVRATVRSGILPLMVAVPEKVRKHLAEALMIMFEYDFPDRWPTLVAEMVALLNTQDYSIVNSVLATAHGMFKKYRHEYPSNELWREIALVLKDVEAPLLKMAQGTLALVDANASNPASLPILLSAMTNITRVHHSLIAQELPTFFVENLATWMQLFHTVLVYQNAALETDDEDESGPIETLQASVIDALVLYVDKYDSDVAQYIDTFVQTVWQRLLSVGIQPKYDRLATNSIRLLTNVCRSTHHKMFNNEELLRKICENVVIPNCSLTDDDIMLYESNWTDYVRKDVEGSDTYTRRRTAFDLVSALCQHYEQQVTGILSSYIQVLLEQYKSNPAQNWRSKDTAVYLITALSVRSSSQSQGTVQTNQLIDVVALFTEYVLPELSTDTPAHPILKADALKFVDTFRSMLPKTLFAQYFPHIVKCMHNPDPVVHSYAATCVEHMLTVKVNGVHLYTRADIEPWLQQLLTGCFAALELPQSRENDYIMKVIMRLCVVVKDGMAPLIPEFVNRFNTIISTVCRNPSNPGFNHYLFETVSALVKFVCATNPSAVATFENLLMPSFRFVLDQDVAEFSPYVFQILSQLLDLSPTPQIPATFAALFPSLLTPALWERAGNVPALAQLLRTYIRKAPEVSGGKLLPVLGIFQKLAASRVNDHQGLAVLNAIIAHLPLAQFAPHLPTIFQLELHRLQGSRTAKLVKSLLVSWSLLAAKHGAAALVDQLEGIQPGLFLNVFGGVWLAEVTRVSGTRERVTCAMGMIALLATSPQLAQDQAVWATTLVRTVELLELPEDKTVNPADEEAYVEVEDTSYTPAFNQLHFALATEPDPLAGADPTRVLVTQLAERERQQPGSVRSIAQSNPAVWERLCKYHTAAGLPGQFLG